MMIRPIWWSRKPTVIEVTLRGRPPVGVVEPGGWVREVVFAGGKGTQTTSIRARRSQLRTHAAAVLVGLVDGSDSGDWPGGFILRVVHTTVRPAGDLAQYYIRTR
jgi:hypothetical protein